MTIRTSLLGGAALGVVLAVAMAGGADAKTTHRRHAAPAADSGLRSEVEQLKGEVQSLEQWREQETADRQAERTQTQQQMQQMQGQVEAANARADNAEKQVAAQIQTIPGQVKQQVASAQPKPGWWANTTVSGRMYYDITNIDQTTNGVHLLNANNANGKSPNGVGFDIKRFYVSIDHTFNSVFSADITTDVLYDGRTIVPVTSISTTTDPVTGDIKTVTGNTTAVALAPSTQIYIKKAYLQAKLNDAFIVRVGSADLPWVPFVEDLYGYRYVENVLIDRTKFGTSADWGIHALGKIPVGDATFNYAIAAISGMGYKKPGFIGGVNRSEGVDFEGRASITFKGFTAAVGGYTGKLGNDFSGVTTFHTANRVDALIGYTNARFRLYGEYMNANDWNDVTHLNPHDSSDAWSVFGSVNITPQIAIFGRYDWVKPRNGSIPTQNNSYYNIGVSYEPTKIVDFALVYKHDQIDHGAFSTQNFATSSSNVHGDYDEVGVWGQFRW